MVPNGAQQQSSLGLAHSTLMQLTDRSTVLQTEKARQKSKIYVATG